MKRSLNKAVGRSARVGSRRLGLFGRRRDDAAGNPVRVACFEALEGRTLLSGVPAGWQAEPVAMPHYLSGLHAPGHATARTHGSRHHSTTTASMVRAAYAGSSTAYGLTPAQVRGAYGVNNVSFNGISGNGSGETIAIVDAYDDPNALSDLNAFSSHFGLPAFNSGSGSPTFAKLNQSGGTSLPGTDPAGPYSSTGGGDWEQEESLDIEWAHAIAPQANIKLYEASSAGSGLYTAISTARQTSGVTVVSMSWGGSEFSGETSYDGSYFTTPSGHVGAGGLAGGITFVSSSGDQGAYSPGTSSYAVSYPAASPDVLAVGGTSLTVSGNSYVSESGWGNGTSSGSAGGSGGGVSSQESQPAYQKGVVTQTSSGRALPDVSMLADPNTGVPVYDSWDFGASTPWIPGYEGGTSLAAPMWGALVAIADQGRNINHLGSLDGATQTIPTLYKLPASDFHDVTTGNNGYAAGPGFDLVTGRGSPIANTLVADLAGVSTSTAPAPSAPSVAGLAASPSTVTSGASFTLSASGVSDPNAGGSVTKVSFYRESNGSAGLQTSGTADTLVGAATTGSNGVWTLSVNSTGLATRSYTYYAVATDSAGLNSAPVSTGVTVQAAPANSATYVRTDSTTLGNWKGAYGSQGEYVAGDSYTAPSYASITSNGYTYVWNSSSTSGQDLQRAASTGRIGSMLYASRQLQVGVNVTDGHTHQVAFYIPAWNTWTAQYESVAAYDTTSGALLSSQTVNTGTGGKYVVFNVSGNVTFTFAPASSGYYGVIGGLFLDPAV